MIKGSTGVELMERAVEGGGDVFNTVVVGTDGSDTANKAATQAIDLAKESGGSIHIVSAYKPQEMRAGGDEEFEKSLDSVDLAESLVSDWAARARVAGVAVDTHIGTGSPADLICRIAGQVNADLIVVGNKGMTGARRVLGSVPNSVAHKAPCSVLILSTT